MADRIDELTGQWRAERPDIDVDTMALVLRLLHAAGRANAVIEGTAGEHGLDRGQGDVLFTLRRAGAPYRLSPTQLAASTLVTSGTMTNRIDRLEARGLVRRIPSTTDRRSLDVELTAEAVALVDAAVTEHVAREQEFLAPLSERERSQLDRLLRKLLAG